MFRTFCSPEELWMELGICQPQGRSCCWTHDVCCSSSCLNSPWPHACNLGQVVSSSCFTLACQHMNGNVCREIWVHVGNLHESHDQPARHKAFRCACISIQSGPKVLRRGEVREFSLLHQCLLFHVCHAGPWPGKHARPLQCENEMIMWLWRYDKPSDAVQALFPALPAKQAVGRSCAQQLRKPDRLCCGRQHYCLSRFKSILSLRKHPWRR